MRLEDSLLNIVAMPGHAAVINLLPCYVMEACGNAGSHEVRDMVSSVTEVAHGDAHMACHLWVLVFPIVWATLSEKKEQQIQLAKPIIALLSKEYHLKQAQHRPNVVQVTSMLIHSWPSYGPLCRRQTTHCMWPSMSSQQSALKCKANAMSQLRAQPATSVMFLRRRCWRASR